MTALGFAVMLCGFTTVAIWKDTTCDKTVTAGVAATFIGGALFAFGLFLWLLRTAP